MPVTTIIVKGLNFSCIGKRTWTNYMMFTTYTTKMEWNRKTKHKKMDNYIPGNYKWKESSLGDITIIDVKAEASNGKMSMLHVNNKWMNEYV